jgi:hypothetical protein
MAQVTVQAGGTDSTSVLAPAVMAFCAARRAKADAGQHATTGDTDPIVVGDRQYWFALAAIERADLSSAATAAAAGLASLGTLANDELRWRLEATAAASAASNDDAERHRVAAGEVLARVRATFSNAATQYESRPDLRYLKRRAGLT